MRNKALSERVSKGRFVLVKFAGVGALATIVHASMYLFCVSTFLLNPQLANLLAYLVALVFSYFGQRGWAFSHTSNRGDFATKGRFFLSSLFAYALNAAWVVVVIDFIQAPAMYVLFGIVFLTPAVTFLLFKYWVFVGDSGRVQDKTV